MVDHEQARHDHGYHPIAVKSVVQETHDTRSYVLDVPEDLHDLFRYQAGQFCTFRVHLDEGPQLRSYSMSSAPETDRDLTVTVKRVPDGLVSNWFHDHVEVGDVLEVTKPAGVFCLRSHEVPVVAFCGGSGVTPVMSVARSALAGSTRPVRILYANRDRESVIFRDELASLEARHPDRLVVRHHLDADGGFLDAAEVAEFAAATLDADFYICGPTPFMDLVESTLLGMGVDPDQILIERFGPAEEPPLANDDESSTRVASGRGADERSEASTAARTDDRTRDESQRAREVPEHVTIVLNGKSTEVGYRDGDTVLETARRGGLQPPFSCEAGNCATCMALLRDGRATMRTNNALTPDEVDEGWILTCQALPEGPTVTVEYESF